MNALLIVLAIFIAVWVCAYHRYSALGWTAVIAVGLGALTSKVISRSPHSLCCGRCLQSVRLCSIRRRCAALCLAHRCSRCFAASCRRCRRPSRRRSTPAPCGGTASCSAAAGWSRAAGECPSRGLTREQAFLVGPKGNFLCAMLDDWDITHTRQDLSPEVWQFIKDKGFFGMIIPKQYGGLGFSAQAHSAVVSKVASRSGTAAVTVMVPNSLGPAELLLHYGTDQQKEKYLPRLAKGLEVPCFALTGPFAGSDAGAIPDYGVVCHGNSTASRTCSACASPGKSATSRSARWRRCSDWRSTA